MNRENAPDNLKWKLSDIFETHNDWDIEYQNISKLLPKLQNFKGKLSKKEEFLKYLKFNEDFGKRIGLLFDYCFLNSDIDKSNNQFIEDSQKMELLSTKIGELTAYVSPELASLPKKYFEEILTDKRFKAYNHAIDSFLRSRHFILSEKEEKALATTESFSDGFDNVYDAITQNDIKFDKVVINNKKIDLTQSNYVEFLENKNENIRKQAYENMYKCFKQFSKTLGLNYISFVKMCCSDLKLRKQTSFLQSAFYSRKMPEKIYSNLIDQVNKNTKLEQEYFRLLKKQVNSQKFGFKDVYLSLATKINKKYSIFDQKNIVFDALSPLGEEYQQLLKTAFDNNWIDFCKGKNKKSGGYMLGVYGVHPFVLLNDNSNYDSLSTLAHELGHAMHTYYSDKNQPYEKHEYATFIAEIASTVNEILLNKYMLNNAKTNQEKLFYIDNYLQSFKGTVFRQTMFSEFEDYAFKIIENDGILSPQLLTKKYSELLKKHFGNVVPVDDCIIYECFRIPHFYSPYYVFQYATSFISACYIANKILSGDKQMIKNYKSMLCSGGDGYPTEILAKTGIDLTKQEVFDFAFNEMKSALKLAKTLIK